MQTVKSQIVLFIVMFFLALTLNPMNILAHKIGDVYLSLTLIYSALFMASNMIWSHQIVHYLSYNNMNSTFFWVGVLMSLISSVLLRFQFGVSGEQWLKRMIGHHSTAITTTQQLLNNAENFSDNPKLYRLAKDIVYSQEREILFMKGFLQNYFA
jgi:hypothetical protein